MYDSLTALELTALQDMLFRAVERVYWTILIEDGDDAWLKRYHPLHRELGELFIEAGEELLLRLDHVKTPA